MQFHHQHLPVRRVLVGALVAAVLSACTPAQVAETLRSNHVPPTQQTVQAIVQATNDAGARFLRDAAALHNEPFLVCTRAHESDTAGGYTAYSSVGPYYGAYQYLQHTWDTAAVNYGNYSPQFVGVPPTQVPGFFQDLITWRFYLAVGNGPWAGRC